MQKTAIYGIVPQKFPLDETYGRLFARRIVSQQHPIYCDAEGRRSAPSSRIRSKDVLNLAVARVPKELKSPTFYSGCQSEYAHIACVLPFGDEFRQRIAF